MTGPPRQEIDVLNLVTTESAEFFRNQVTELERHGVQSTTLSLPDPTVQNGQKSRSVCDYIRFYPTSVRHSFGDYDLVHANYGLMAPFALAQPNLPVVLTLWGSDLLGKYQRVSQWCSRYCDAVIVMSEQMASLLDVECTVIPHGVDLTRFAPRSQSLAMDELGWDPTKKHVLFPYRPTRPVKDFPRAERIVERVRGRLDEPVELQVATGIAHEDIPTYMNAADALLMTSKHEGSPNTIKEALACNLPVVSTDVGDVAERLDGVQPSFIGRTDDELVDALVETLHRGTRSNGRAAVQELSLQRMGERIHDVYTDALA